MFEQIREELAKQFKRDKESITLETTLSEDLRADSLDVMELLMTMEDNYGVVVPDEDIINFQTVGDIVEYVESHKEN
ncbi:MAG: acyl carrier protein [Clostridia bacterium]|jgi:acyl carrier protein|nr:acyl carrier protein [Clostridia bacterium]MBO4860832.1 acyl carrier protein [Clostridia bacterium]MBO7666427.1 acyl carrier protein [Clostridia bacterium]MBP5238343.1 acyl carrier protein [Clostridia bacterium]MBP5657351.1 acyl carrier protein [Clostridia bacterium]